MIPNTQQAQIPEVFEQQAIQDEGVVSRLHQHLHLNQQLAH